MNEMLAVCNIAKMLFSIHEYIDYIKSENQDVFTKDEVVKIVESIAEVFEDHMLAPLDLKESGQ